MSTTGILQELVGYVDGKLAQNVGQIERCVRLLGDEWLWHRANPHTNSVGNLLLHLTGNVRQWMVAGVGRAPWVRDRPAEFAERGPLPADGVLAGLVQAVNAARQTLAGLTADALGERRTIQGYEVSVLVALLHVLEHFSFHTGQIVQITKTVKDIDLSLYDEQGRPRDPAVRKP